MRNKPFERCHGGNGNTSRIYVEDTAGHNLSHEDNVPEVRTEPASTRVKRRSSSDSAQQAIKSAPQPQTRLSPQIQERQSVQTITAAKQSYGKTTMTTMVKSSQMNYSETSQRQELIPEETPKPRKGTSAGEIQVQAQVDPMKRAVNPNATVSGGGGGSEGGGGEESEETRKCDGTCCVHTINGLLEDVAIVVDDSVVAGSPALNGYFKFETDGQSIRLVKVKDTVLSLNGLDRNLVIKSAPSGGIKVETVEEEREIRLSTYWV